MKSQEEKIRICGEDRNSYSKTDNDATFMHMKYDYYNNTGVFKPGYNLQCLIKDEYVSELYVSNHRTDSKTLPFILDRYTDSYNEKPNNLVADAGYGSYDNYMYMLNKRINAYVKYNTYQKEKTSKSKLMIVQTLYIKMVSIYVLMVKNYYLKRKFMMIEIII